MSALIVPRAYCLFRLGIALMHCYFLVSDCLPRGPLRLSRTSLSSSRFLVLSSPSWTYHALRLARGMFFFVLSVAYLGRAGPADDNFTTSLQNQGWPFALPDLSVSVFRYFAGFVFTLQYTIMKLSAIDIIPFVATLYGCKSTLVGCGAFARSTLALSGPARESELLSSSLRIIVRINLSFKGCPTCLFPFNLLAHRS